MNVPASADESAARRGGGYRRRRPKGWRDFWRSGHSRWLYPLLLLDWLADWAAYALSRLSILELLEYCGSFSVLVAVIFYFMEAPERTKTRHYQAWQVINTAQGKGGSGGRIDALRELNEDGVALVGVDLTDAFLQGVRLENADLRRSTFDSADLQHALLRKCRLELSSLHFANLRGADLTEADLNRCNLNDADLSGAILRLARVNGVTLDGADLRGADLSGLAGWEQIQSIKSANVFGIRNPPPGFVAWASSHGAVNIESDARWPDAEKQAALAK